MSAVNKHIISGRVGRKPELRYTPNSTAVSSFSVARQPRHLNKATNQWEDGEVTWYDVTVFNRLAENVVASLDSGIEVTVIGDLKKRSYVAKDGTNKDAWELVADDVTISLDHQIVQIADKSAYGNKSGGTGAAPAQRSSAAAAPSVNEDDAPF